MKAGHLGLVVVLLAEFVVEEEDVVVLDFLLWEATMESFAEMAVVVVGYSILRRRELV